MSIPAAPSRRSCTRADAAALLREARRQVLRQTQGLAADPTTIDWALFALPDSFAARRLTIQSLLLAADERHVDALLARSLRRWPDRPALLLLQAQRLLDRGEPDAAERIITAALRQRPRHVATLRCAGRIAAAQGRRAEAADLLRRAFERSVDADRDAVGRELVHALLAADRPDEAEEIVRSLNARSDDLLAMIRAAQGRTREAIELMERAAVTAEDHAAREAMLCGLVTMLEQAHDHARLREVLRSLEDAAPVTRLRAGLAWLALGEFDAAEEAVADLVEDSRHGHAAQAVLIASAAMTGRLAGAEQLVRSFNAVTEGSDRWCLADAWARAIQGSIIAEQSSAAAAGADPSASLLRPLLDRALKSFDEALADTGAALDRPSLELHRHRAACAELLAQGA